MNPMKNVCEVSSSNIDPELLNLRSVCHVEKNMCSKFQVPTPTRIWHLAVLGSQSQGLFYWQIAEGRGRGNVGWCCKQYDLMQPLRTLQDPHCFERASDGRVQ